MTYPIVEIFGPTIQGEGLTIGRPTVFVRFGGCDDRCHWCDSLHAVDAAQYKATWTPLSVDAIVARIRACAPPPILVTFSGGNPALHRLGLLVDRLHDAGYSITVETQGTRCPPWLALVDSVTVSPKPPSSGNPLPITALTDWRAFAHRHTTSFKVVVMDDDDLAYLEAVVAALAPHEVIVQVGNPYPTANDTPRQIAEELLTRYLWLWERLRSRGLLTVRLLPQLHVLLWGNQRGV